MDDQLVPLAISVLMDYLPEFDENEVKIVCPEVDAKYLRDLLKRLYNARRAKTQGAAICAWAVEVLLMRIPHKTPDKASNDTL